jgi:hypothetical protein
VKGMDEELPAGTCGELNCHEIGDSHCLLLSYREEAVEHTMVLNDEVSSGAVASLMKILCMSSSGNFPFLPQRLIHVSLVFAQKVEPLL